MFYRKRQQSGTTLAWGVRTFLLLCLLAVIFPAKASAQELTLDALGDITGDGICTLSDITEMYRAASGKRELSVKQSAVADYDHSGKVAIADAKDIYRLAESALTEEFGDITGDDVCDLSDVAEIFLAASGKREFSAQQVASVDYNHNERVDVADAKEAFRLLAGLESMPPEDVTPPEGVTPKIQKAEVSEITADGYTVTVTISGDMGLVDRVQFPTWTTAGGQNDIQSSWQNNRAASGVISGNTAVYRVNVSAHGYEGGEYNTHIYVYLHDGTRIGYTLRIQVPVECAIAAVKAVDVSALGYTVRVELSGNISGIDRVQFPTWSTANGQDDIQSSWQTSESARGSVTGNLVIYRVNISNHYYESGEYNTHVYLYTSSGFQMRAIKVVVPKGSLVRPELQKKGEADRLAKQIVAQITNGSMTKAQKLRACYEYIVKNGSYSAAANIPLTKSGYDPRHVPLKTGWQYAQGELMLSEHKGVCYTFAGGFAALANAVGYDATVVAGECASRSGGTTPHGWVEIVINGVRYVYDPDYDNHYGTLNAYQFTYGSGHGWTPYIIQQRAKW